MRDYYKLLGVDPSADTEVIKAAYRALARKYHPDVNNDPKAEEIFKLISEAYETIGDSSNRREYDVKYNFTKSTVSPPSSEQNVNSTKTSSKRQILITLLLNFLTFLIKLVSPFLGLVIVFGGLMLAGWICNAVKSNKEGPTPSQPQTGQIPFQSPTPQAIKVDTFADWDAVELRTGKTPDCFNFNPKYDKSIDNKLQISVGNNSDVVVKLINALTGKCIRYVFIRAGDTYNIRHIPEGVYYTKIAYGKDWRQKVINNRCKGKFVDSPLYKVGEERLDFNIVSADDGYQIPSFSYSTC
jgi:hypothetical protein